MHDSMSFLAPDGLLELEAADIEEVAIDEAGAHVLLKDGHTCSLFGHECPESEIASPSRLRLADEVRSPDGES